MNKRKDVLTTGQVAQICNVAPRTVTKWFDSGQLKGYRIPGSKDRRIPTNELIRFMKSHDIPIEGLEIGQIRILIVDNDWNEAETLCNALKSKKDYDTAIAQNNFDAGVVAQKMLPHVIMINLMSQEIDADQICSYVKSSQDLSETKLIAIASGLNGNGTAALLQKGYEGVISDPADIMQTLRIIDHATTLFY